jgi:hypothetical protein
MSNNEPSAPEQIDAIIRNIPDWRSKTLAQLRSIITQAHPDIVEEVKWKKPSKPEGVPVWMYNGNICVADTLKNAVRLTFPKGAQLPDPTHLFNTRLDSKTVRAVDFFEGSAVDSQALSALIQAAATLNTATT